MTEVSIHDPTNYDKYRTALLDELEKVKIPRIQKGHKHSVGASAGKYISQRGDVIGLIGRTANFGYGMIRHAGFGPFVANRRFSKVYQALCDFADVVVPPDFHFNTITLNHNVKAKKHKDIYNVGDSIIIGIGDYEGGALRVFSNDTDYSPENIKDRPIKFNGHTTFHETEDFTGTRYTMIFFKQKKDKDLPRPSRTMSEEQKAKDIAFYNKVEAYYDSVRLKKQAKK